MTAPLNTEHLTDMTPQACPAGIHADWAVDSELDHTCPWCRIAELEAERHTTNEALSKRDVEMEKKDRRLAELDARLNAVGAARTWRMENGKKFIYVEDIASAVLGDAAAAIREKDAVVETATEYGVRVPEEDGTVHVIYVSADRATAASELRGHRAAWPGIGQKLVQRTVSCGEWTEVTP